MITFCWLLKELINEETTIIIYVDRQPIEELSIEDKIIKTFPDNPDLMLAIAECESGLRQFDDSGNYIKSHTNDSGLFQINDATWKTTADNLNLDYKHSVDDNIEMARYIYDTQGVNAWVCLRLIDRQTLAYNP